VEEAFLGTQGAGCFFGLVPSRPNAVLAVLVFGALAAVAGRVLALAAPERLPAAPGTPWRKTDMRACIHACRQAGV